MSPWLRRCMRALLYCPGCWLEESYTNILGVLSQASPALFDEVTTQIKSWFRRWRAWARNKKTNISWDREPLMMKRPSYGKKKKNSRKILQRGARAAVSERPLGADNRRGRKKKQINTGALQFAESNFEVPPDKIALTSGMDFCYLDYLCFTPCFRGVFLFLATRLWGCWRNVWNLLLFARAGSTRAPSPMSHWNKTLEQFHPSSNSAPSEIKLLTLPAGRGSGRKSILEGLGIKMLRGPRKL